MVVEEIVGDTSDVLTNFAVEIGKIGLWLQALGIIVILWIIFQVVALIVNRINRKTLFSIKKDLARIEKKINQIEKVLIKKK